LEGKGGKKRSAAVGPRAQKKKGVTSPFSTNKRKRGRKAQTTCSQVSHAMEGGRPNYYRGEIKKGKEGKDTFFFLPKNKYVRKKARRFRAAPRKITSFAGIGKKKKKRRRSLPAGIRRGKAHSARSFGVKKKVTKVDHSRGKGKKEGKKK